MVAFQSPSLRGSGRFSPSWLSWLPALSPFQSPSLRGSGRFQAGGTSPDPDWIGVSIPFIAGQWSLRDDDEQVHSSSLRFNPLHCGAVVASITSDVECHGTIPLVSIPFIAGQWSLRRGICSSPSPTHTAFQSPSLRGSGRFTTSTPGSRPPTPAFQSPSLRGSGRFVFDPFSNHLMVIRFNPLHCGAVVASTEYGADYIISASEFQSPSLRGSGRFPDNMSDVWSAHIVSIPFIAGQWSLRPPDPGVAGSGAEVSIPFIAGQWSLHLGADRAVSATALFQSPSLRGSGRFARAARIGSELSEGFNPLHCGAVVASEAAEALVRCGDKFQSPSLRGSGRFTRTAPV